MAGTGLIQGVGMRIGIMKILSIAGLAAGPALAHLEPGSMTSPQAGASYPAGSKVNITWVQAEYHRGNYALAFSKNGGSTWESIASWTGPSGDGVAISRSSS
jgi:hypothetical protein